MAADTSVYKCVCAAEREREHERQGGREAGRERETKGGVAKGRRGGEEMMRLFQRQTMRQFEK